LDLDVLVTLLGKLSLDPSLADFVTPLAACVPSFFDQATQTKLLRDLPMVDDIGITTQQRGHESQGMQIPGSEVAGDQGGTSTGPRLWQGEGESGAIWVCF
jgi:hypothetical protein